MQKSWNVVASKTITVADQFPSCTATPKGWGAVKVYGYWSTHATPGAGSDVLFEGFGLGKD